MTQAVTDFKQRRRRELFAFLALTVLLAPIVAVATVGTYGLSIWLYQIVSGPPGHSGTSH